MSESPKMTKHSRSGEPLLQDVFADPGVNGFYYREKKPDSVARYTRTDLCIRRDDPALVALVEALNSAQYGLSWAVRYFKDQDVTKDDPCPPCTRGLSATCDALTAWDNRDDK